MKPKQQRAPKFPPPPTLELDEQLLVLQQEDRRLTNQIVEAESRGWQPQPPADESVDVEAYALLQGKPPPAQPVQQPSLQTLYRKRQVLRRALELGQQLSAEAHASWQRSAIAERLDEWRELVRQRAVLALQLRRVNRQCEEFKTALGGDPSLPCNTPPSGLLGSAGVVGDELYRFTQMVLSEGILTKSEIAELLGE